MEGVGLCFFLPLLLGAAWADEICPRWTAGVQEPVEVFHCPTQEDGVDVNFCCGTCDAPYCCSSGAARLDPDQCPGSGQWKVDRPLLMTNISEALITATPLSNAIAAVLVLGVMAVVVLDVLLCCYVIMHCARARDEVRQRGQVTEDTDTSTRHSSHDSSPPRGYLCRIRRWFGSLSMRSMVSNNPPRSYSAFVDHQVISSSAEDSAPPQDESLPSLWFD